MDQDESRKPILPCPASVAGAVRDGAYTGASCRDGGGHKQEAKTRMQAVMPDVLDVVRSGWYTILCCV